MAKSTSPVRLLQTTTDVSEKPAALRRLFLCIATAEIIELPIYKFKYGCGLAEQQNSIYGTGFQ